MIVSFSYYMHLSNESAIGISEYMTQFSLTDKFEQVDNSSFSIKHLQCQVRYNKYDRSFIRMS